MTATEARRYARLAGVLFLFSILGGGFGEMYAPSQLIVGTDATATAANLRNSEWLFRLGFAAYLVEALCDVALAWLFYLLLRPVHRELALLAAFFGLVSTAIFGVSQMIYFASSLVIGDSAYLAPFSLAQRDTLAMLAVKTYGLGSAIFMAFYGTASVIRGYLVFRSTYLPRFIGALLMFAGAAFIASNFVVVLAPRYATPLFYMPMGLTGIALAAWLLTKGVDAARWRAMIVRANARRVAPVEADAGDAVTLVP